MKLDSDYQLISDTHNFILQKYRKKKKQWDNVGYWKDLSQALGCYVRRRRRYTLTQVPIKRLIASEKRLYALIEGIGKDCRDKWGSE